MCTGRESNPRGSHNGTQKLLIKLIARPGFNIIDILKMFSLDIAKIYIWAKADFQNLQ